MLLKGEGRGEIIIGVGLPLFSFKSMVKLANKCPSLGTRKKGVWETTETAYPDYPEKSTSQDNIPSVFYPNPGEDVAYEPKVRIMRH